MRNNKDYEAGGPVVRGVQFSPIEPEEGDISVSPSSIELLQDVPLAVTAELGRSKMLVKDILRLGVGSVIELDKETGEPLDLMVNNKLIARGEVVEIDGNFGIRVTEIPGK
ncbi:MAG: flagellar motor switch protein FliN [Vulcanimicrobiota bacterium]